MSSTPEVDVSNMALPSHPHLVYIFDVDGTLTPHPGDDTHSMWHMQYDYTNRLTSEIIQRMANLLSLLPYRIILISRNKEDVIMDILGSIDSTFPARVDKVWSSFRRSGMSPTLRSKRSAFTELANIPAHIVYIDDSQTEIEIFKQIPELYGKSLPIKIDKWLGDTQTYEYVWAAVHTYIQNIK